MNEHTWSLFRPSSLVIFLLLVVLSLLVGPVAAQTRPLCVTAAGGMGWNEDAASGTTFTMTKDCRTASNRVLRIKDNKTFTIDGRGQYTIYAADKAEFNDRGTVIHFDGGSNIKLTLKNLTIEGGGGAASPTGNDPDPAIVFRNGNLLLDRVTIQNTRGGAIRVIGIGTLTVKNSSFIGNQVAAGSSDGPAITTKEGSPVRLQGSLTMKSNISGTGGAIHVIGDTLNIDALTCRDTSGNVDATGAGSTLHIVALVPVANALATQWGTVPKIIPCPLPPLPSPVGGLGMVIAQGDSNAGRRILGMIGSQSAYYHKDSGGVMLLQIYRVDGNSVGHWVMNVSQAAIDALDGAGCVASSPDGRYAVRVWADGNITVSDGPDHENKVLHNTLMGGVSGEIIVTETTYSTTPPGMGCPGYMG